MWLSGVNQMVSVQAVVGLRSVCYGRLVMNAVGSVSSDEYNFARTSTFSSAHAYLCWRGSFSSYNHDQEIGAGYDLRCPG